MTVYNTLSDLLNGSFDEYGSNTAFEDLEKGSFTYVQTQIQSRQIADFIIDKGIKSRGIILVCADKSFDSLTCIFGAILADNVYVPVDNLAPIHRVETIIVDCQPEACICEELMANSFSSSKGHQCEVFPIPDTSLFFVVFKQRDIKCQDLPVDLAYILYTSGSTGRPKGVMITHENALSFIGWGATTFHLSQHDVFASVAPFHFDLSVFDLFVSMWHGAKVVLLNDKTIRNPLMLSEQIARYEISVWYSTPTILMLLVKYGKLDRYEHSSLRVVNYAGEVFPIEPLKELKQYWTKAQFNNLYGPTETNVCTWDSIPGLIENGFTTNTIGISCDHINCKLLNEEEEIIDPKPEMKGELIVSGSAVSPGYLNRLELNKKSYLKTEQGVSWYRTGDAVQMNESGAFEFLGRLDRMIKRNGYRIELGEIEKVIEQYESIERASVIDFRSKGKMLLRVFLQAERTDENWEGVKSFTMKRLPSYMHPDEWIWVDDMPMTSTQKVDYQKLTEWKVLN